MPELLLIAEVKGEPVAFSMTLPDANVALKAANGRLTTLRPAHRAGEAAAGLAEDPPAAADHPRHQGGLPQARHRRDPLPGHAAHRAPARLQGGEISWTLEDNHLVNRAIESMGGKRSKTYRIYERAL